MAITKKRYQKDTAKELIQGYFEGLIKQNRKFKERARLNPKNNNSTPVPLNEDI